jgi:ketosteroid isomerase-like protein
MPTSDAEILREMWDEWLSMTPLEVRDDFVERWWHPEIEYVEDPRWPGSGTYRGLDAVKGAFAGYLEVFGSAELSLERLVDAEDQLVALVRFTGVSSGAEVPTEHVWGYVCRAQDGKLIYLRAYWNPQEALDAAGVG